MPVELDSHMSTAYALASWSQKLSAGQPQYDKQSSEAWQRDEARRVQVELDNHEICYYVTIDLCAKLEHGLHTCLLASVLLSQV